MNSPSKRNITFGSVEEFRNNTVRTTEEIRMQK
jgi:hypothetical protein